MVFPECTSQNPEFREPQKRRKVPSRVAATERNTDSAVEASTRALGTRPRIWSKSGLKPGRYVGAVGFAFRGHILSDPLESGIDAQNDFTLKDSRLKVKGRRGSFLVGRATGGMLGVRRPGALPVEVRSYGILGFQCS